MTEILIVDDSSTNRTILERLVRGIEQDAIIRTFSLPDEALLAVRAGDPELVITNFSMPNLNGAEFARRCRADPNFHGAIIIVTALRDRARMYEALEAGVADFLASPVDHRELAIRVRNTLAAARTVKQLAAARRALERERALDAVRVDEEAGRRSRRYRDVLDAISWPVLAVRGDQRISFANRAFGAMVGARLAELPGSGMTELLSPLRLARDVLRADAKARRERGPIVLATSMHGGSGAPLNLRLHACPIGDGHDNGDVVLLFAPAEATADPAAMLATALIP